MIYDEELPNLDERRTVEQRYIAPLLELEAKQRVIEGAMEMYPHLHKVLCGKSVCIIDESTAEKSILRDVKNVAMCYKSSKDKIILDRMRGNKLVSELIDAFPVWFNNAAVCQKIVCEPDYPFGEMFQNGFRVFNDWEEAEAKEGEGTTDLFWQHIREDVCDGNEERFKYFQMWAYDLIANPLHRNGVAIAISGNQGCGKSIISDCLKLCFHPKYFSTINNSSALQDKFDAVWKNSILVSLEESTFAGDRKSGVWSKMKDLVSSRETTIERKGVDVQRIINKLHFIITSNDEFLVPKQRTDRRYFVLRCNDNRRCDTEFFGSLIWNMENGGAFKLIQEAKEHRQEALDFDYRKIPETEIGAENMLETCPLIVRHLISFIDELNDNDLAEYEHYELPFYYDKESKEIILNSSKLIEHYRNETGDKTFMTPRKVGKMLRELTGKESIDRRIYTEIIPTEGHVLKCFVFSNIEELKSNITQHYFGGLNPFV